MRRPKMFLLLIFAAFCRASAFGTDPGYVLHFDFLSNEKEALQMLDVARRGGAKVINLVPPAHVWNRRDALAILDKIIRTIEQDRLKFVITRVDASYPPDAKGQRSNYLYEKILNRPGILPTGKPTSSFFLTTVGAPGYADWMEDETRFYAKRYGRSRALIGFNLGPFSEPFVSQRGGFLQYDTTYETYEITQYTKPMEKVWRRYLRKRYRIVERLNTRYQSHFAVFDEVPLPKNSRDSRIPAAAVAYGDFVASINDWFWERYDTCRTLWRKKSRRADVPFILQLSGYDEEKFRLGRPAYKRFQVNEWIRQADAIGLSLYTNGEYPDFGHQSIRATINQIQKARPRDRKVFVLESGCENPLPQLNRKELNFIVESAERLSPKTFIYEFLKDPFYARPAKNSGRIMAKDGSIREDVLTELKAIMHQVRNWK